MFLFVYGTLKKNFQYHYLIENQEFLGRAVTQDNYALFLYPEYDFPFLSTKEIFPVSGELYKIINIKDIDRLEEAPEFFYRKEIPVICNGVKFMAFAYFLIEEPLVKEPFFNF
jgi:gamma-glutamylcyclotransferase (GGCT)/AIG2-like uncharacterized protein YtfP